MEAWFEGKNEKMYDSNNKIIEGTTVGKRKETNQEDVNTSHGYITAVSGFSDSINEEE